MGFYVKCPYFRSTKNESITCEDCIRHFESKKDRDRWIRRYCEPYQDCIYAEALDELYERIEPMDEKDARIEKLEHESRCKAAEITKLRKESSNLKNKLEIERQHTEQAKDKAAKQHSATLYLADAKDRELRKLEGRLSQNEFVNAQRIRALENYIGMLHKRFNLESFRIREIHEFGQKYEVLCKIPDVQKGQPVDIDEVVVTVEVKERSNAGN